MRVVHLSYDYGLKGTSGAPIAATRLHLALLRAGVDSHFICVRQLEAGPNVVRLPRSRLAQKIFYFVPRVFWVLSRWATGHLLMPNIWPLPGFDRAVAELMPDVVHIHLIAQDMVSFAQLARLNCKVVYTLHDILSVNAIEPYPNDDRRYAEGFTDATSSRAERWMFARKRRLLEKLNPVFTGPSDWICNLFRESLLGRGRPVRRVLNIIDPTYGFEPALLKSHAKFTVLFGAFNGRTSPYKGWADLEAALKLLPEEIRRETVVNVFGEAADDYEIGGVQIHFVGVVKDPAKMRELHHAADVLALPSRQDNAPQVKFESLLDGLPVLAFQRTGCAEFIEPKENGWVSPDGDIADYAQGLAYFNGLFKRGELDARRAPIAAAAQAQFAEEGIVREMMAIYGGFAPTGRSGPVATSGAGATSGDCPTAGSRLRAAAPTGRSGVTKQRANYCNQFIAQNAAEIWVGHVRPGGSLETILRATITGR